MTLCYLSIAIFFSNRMIRSWKISMLTSASRGLSAIADLLAKTLCRWTLDDLERGRLRARSCSQSMSSAMDRAL